MTIRTVALCIFVLCIALGVYIAATINRDCSDQNHKIESRSNAIANLAKSPIQNAPQDGSKINGAIRIHENGIEYRENNELIGKDYLDSDSQLARRDILVNGRTRAYEFFTKGKLVRRQFLDVDGSVECTNVPQVILPLIPRGY